MLISAVQQSDSDTRIYMHSSYSFPLWLITGYWVQFPLLCSRTALLITAVIADENGFLRMNQFSFKKHVSRLILLYPVEAYLTCKPVFILTHTWKHSQSKSFWKHGPFVVIPQSRSWDSGRDESWKCNGASHKLQKFPVLRWQHFCKGLTFGLVCN